MLQCVFYPYRLRYGWRVLSKKNDHSVLYHLLNFAGENIPRIYIINYTLHFIMMIIPCKSIKNDEELAYTFPNLICEIRITRKISIPEYCFINMIIAWPGTWHAKIDSKKIMRIYIPILRRTASRILPDIFCAFQVIRFRIPQSLLDKPPTWFEKRN